ncbi:MAG TPA: malto-oligosyltrehalose synthase [Rhizomicrobium sp.]|jgi:malto-oligosyltrehalose synthase
MNLRATYRLQFRKEFGFEDAIRIVPYLARLGVSHIYASPILTARKGSPHGYDVIDPSRINPELGGEEGFRSLAAAASNYGLGMILDIVPNHMATDHRNAWWMDVLARGRDSAYAHFFDIDWEPPDSALRGKVLIPVLAAPLVDSLAKGDIALGHESDGTSFVAYFEHRFPLRPDDARLVRHRDFPHDALQELLDRQHYRLAWWRTAGDIINWRRFFDINHLVALRMEDDSVFEAVHAKMFALYAEGHLDGFRIDHVDGLADPGAYCRKLRARLAALRPGRAYIVVEKILAPGEELPGDWDMDGTTGYDFMSDVSAVLHDPAGAEPFARAWADLSGRPADFDDEERAARREMLAAKFRGAFEATLRAFLRLPVPVSHDMTEAAERRALLSLLTELRVYRTYESVDADSPAPRALFDSAVTRALRRAPANDAAALAFVVQAIRNPVAEADGRRSVAVRRFNQLAAALAAKAGEDTAFYRFGRLLSRNEVGADPGEFAITPAVFHARTVARSRCAPLLATATHDHKRGADARMRLAVLSEISGEWQSTVAVWFETNAGIREPELDRGEEYQLYQTLVATWPLELSRHDKYRMAKLAERILGWWMKSLHEEKLHTSWSNPNRTYEAASADFVRRLLDPDVSGEFLASLSHFVQRIAPAAALNSLAQCVLHCTTPGIPDLYQGTEYWDVSLVDPDNRRPVDFAARSRTLASEIDFRSALTHWRDGSLKQQLIARLLALRAEHPEVFRCGDYRPLVAEGARAEHVVAFARSDANTTIMVAVPRLCAQPCIEVAMPLPRPQFWKDTALVFPAETSGRSWRPLFGGDFAMADAGTLTCAELFAHFPAAVLIAQ